MALTKVDDVTANEISTNIYSRGVVVLAAVYDDAGTVKYGEVVL